MKLEFVLSSIEYEQRWWGQNITNVDSLGEEQLKKMWEISQIAGKLYREHSGEPFRDNLREWERISVWPNWRREKSKIDFLNI